MKLTREKAIEEHRKMWRWLAERPSKTKSDYLEIMGMYNNYHLHNRCFLCTYAKAEVERQGLGEFEMCDYCPLDWGGNGCNEASDPLYEIWVFCGDVCDYIGRTEAALQIAELPERKEK